MSLKTFLSLSLLLSARVLVSGQFGDDDDDDTPVYRPTTRRPAPAYTPYQQPRPAQSPYNPYQPRPIQSPYNPYQPQQPRPIQSPYNPYQPQQPQQPRPVQSPYVPYQPQPRPVQSPYYPNQPRPGQQSPYIPPVQTRPIPAQPARPTQQPAYPPAVTAPTRPTFVPTTSYTWTLPTNWGPARAPFGPHEGTSTITGDDGLPTGICTTCGVQTIATTTESGFKVPVPFKTTCGRTAYDEYAVGNALVGGCFYYKKGEKIGESVYPANFLNTQRFNFGAVRGPYYIFPLIKDASFVGGDAGDDFVIFNSECYLAGEITNSTLAVKKFNGWGECSEEF